MRRSPGFFCLSWIFLLWSCGASHTPDVTPREMSSNHFRLSYYGLDSLTAGGLLQHLETNRVRVMDDLSVTEMPPVQIIVHTDSSFNERWGSVIKRSGVSFQVQALSNGVGEIHVYGPWAVRHESGLNAVVLHEFTHGVTLQFALSHGDSSHNFPVGSVPRASEFKDRWLSEAIALYEANQSTDVNWVRRMRNGEYPTLAELNDPANNLIYGIGYRLIEYVRLKWNVDGVRRLILAHGDVQVAFGITPGAFEDGWYDWVVQRYLILSPGLFGSSRYSRRVK